METGQHGDNRGNIGLIQQPQIPSYEARLGIMQII